MKNKLLLLLLIAHFLKELVWLVGIPIWHFPDEEQHFAEVAFYGDENRFPQGSEFDVSKEIDSSSEILGTKRDGRGINKFTYHPEFRIPYIKGEIGLYEDTIKDLNTKENRQLMVKREAGRYGPIYYFLAAIPYKIFFKEDLFVRVFASRFISVILSVINIFFVYLIAKEIFSKEYLRLSLTFLVAFQPMFSFVSAGVNSDNLFNLIFTLILWFCLKIFLGFKNPGNKYYLFSLIGLVIVLTFGFYTKKQIFIGLPIIAFAFFLSFFTQSRKIIRKNLGILSLIGLFFLVISKGRFRIPEYNPYGASKLAESFFEYIFWHLKHTIAETIPWYWGVFNWLGVTLPRWVNRVQARLLILASIGILFYFIKVIKQQKIRAKNNLRIVFLLGAAGIYYFFVICWDYFFRKTQGFSFGIQGRYFFPTVASHMLFIILGLISLVPEKWQKIFSKVLVCWWFVLGLVGLHTALDSYYQFWPLYTFLNQVSQYKPEIFKGLRLIAVFLGFLISSVYFIISFFKFNERKIKQSN